MKDGGSIRHMKMDCNLLDSKGFEVTYDGNDTAYVRPLKGRGTFMMEIRPQGNRRMIDHVNWLIRRRHTVIMPSRAINLDDVNDNTFLIPCACRPCDIIGGYVFESKRKGITPPHDEGLYDYDDDKYYENDGYAVGRLRSYSGFDDAIPICTVAGGGGGDGGVPLIANVGMSKELVTLDFPSNKGRPVRGANGLETNRKPENDARYHGAFVPAYRKWMKEYCYRFDLMCTNVINSKDVIFPMGKMSSVEHYDKFGRDQLKRRRWNKSGGNSNNNISSNINSVNVLHSERNGKRGSYCSKVRRTEEDITRWMSSDNGGGNDDAGGNA